MYDGLFLPGEIINMSLLQKTNNAASQQMTASVLWTIH